MKLLLQCGVTFFIWYFVICWLLGFVPWQIVAFVGYYLTCAMFDDLKRQLEDAKQSRHSCCLKS